MMSDSCKKGRLPEAAGPNAERGDSALEEFLRMVGRYILKRLGISVIVILLVSVISFTLVHMLPGDPAVLALGSEASEQDVEAFREKYYLRSEERRVGKECAA